MNNDEMIYRCLVSTLPTDFPSLISSKREGAEGAFYFN